MSLNFGSDSRKNKTETTAHASVAQTILLAEDEELLRKLFSRTLRAAGYRVLEADCSDTAFEAARSHQKIDVLLSDVHLRGVGGIPLFQELLRADPKIKAVFISGNTRDSLPFSLPSHVAFLEKPFDNDTLVATVRGVLQH